ncbi:hypothetical protein [Carboxylicivirga linearis]|uniref:Uncharacterized protein n=1 Tax=Carboxylicivirga linearis TaxID=1628157 RepID=A0ABS5K0T0_9BACT|nr:hypothetical protein [Carboxylicivirga linearis]MBS2100718.1 hypothetical protein [Carboxylicivirga linearis]
MFGIDFNNVVIWLIPKVLRKAFNIAWLKALVTPIISLYNQFTSYKADILYKLDHNGQVCYLEGALNDAFDTDERRIYISDAGGDTITLIHRDSDNDPLVLDADDYSAFIMHNDSAYFGGSYDFIVNIPYQFSDASLYRLRALVDYYKLAGKRYDVVVN